MKKYIAVILLIVLTMLTGCAEERDKIERQDSDVKELELEKFLETYNEITENTEKAWILIILMMIIIRHTEKL